MSPPPTADRTAEATTYRLDDLTDEVLDVVHHRSGWLSQIIDRHSQPNHQRVTARIWWRDTTPRCCPQQPMRSWGTEDAPVYIENYGRISSHHRQCGRCGGLHFAPVRITRLDAEAIPARSLGMAELS